MNRKLHETTVPRGFSRYYVLTLLAERPMTGKQIIDEAKRMSEGEWCPSPGLIYPLLARLVTSNDIKEVEDGRYSVTEKGFKILQDYGEVHETLRRQMEVVTRLGMASKFLFEDTLDWMSMLANTIRGRLDILREEQRERYSAFLNKELKRVEQEKGSSCNEQETD